MKVELEELFMQKYGKYFPENDPNDKGPKLPSQLFGIECESGWYDLLDNLMYEIDNHIKNYDYNNSNKIKNKRIEDFIRFAKYRAGKRTRKILTPVANFIEKHAKRETKKMIFYITQIKEKFGGLRFYYDGGDRFIDGAVSLAESLSYQICETCGSNSEVGTTRGWVYTICKKCLDANPRLQNAVWIQNKRK